MADNNLPPEDNNNQNPDEDENLAFLPADHPLLARLQAALTKQLSDEHERVDLQLIEQEANSKKLEREKEDIGVRLYSVQQQLAENQLSFEQAHENFNLVQKLRIEAEQKLKQQNDLYLAKKKEVEELKKKYIKAQDELSKLTRTLHQIDQYNEQMKGEISVTKRTVYRAEENVVGLEQQKKKQDLLIDSMNEEIKRLTEQKTIITAQLMSQQEETEQAKQILKEAHIEMQKIIASKKNLLERWQKSLMTMQRMDTALQAIREALQQQKELNIQIGTELNGVTTEIKKEADISENLQYKNQRLENEKKGLEAQHADLIEQRNKLDAQIAMMAKSLAKTEEDAKEAEKEKHKIDEEMNLIETNIMKLHTETKKLWEDLVHSKSEHTTIEKTAANLNKQAQQIEIDIEEKNVELENLLNEIARVKIDQLNTQSQIELLDGKKKEVVKEREQKELLVIVFESQIRTGHDLNEKKQHEVGRLNKLHDDLKSNASEMSAGPQEAVIKNLKREKDEFQQKNETLHRDWIRKQEMLVKQNNQFEQVSESVNGLITRQTIFEQKKFRLNEQYQQHEKEIREIQNALKNLQNEMNKLNDRIYENKEKKQKLENENFNIESEFVEKLKELEKESVKLEVEIDRLKEEKAELLSEIVECERQILLWERKIQLEKEMLEALDPSVGQSEIKELKKQIHIMELQLDEIRKEQEGKINEMERAVYKRETIQLKYINKDKSSGSSSSSIISQGKPQNGTQLGKQISNLKNTLNQTTQNSKQIENGVQQRQNELEQINQQIEEANDKHAILESEVNESNARLAIAKIEKQANIFRISQLQNQARKIDEIVNKSAKLSYPEAQLRQKLNEQRDVNQNIKEALEKLLNDHPNYINLITPLIDLIQ